jgi:hypothetical protein
MSNITSGHVRVFQAVRSQLYDNITLASCTINGEPGVAIVMIDEVGENKIAVMPLFVAIAPSMKIGFPSEGESDGEEGGGPRDDKEEAQHATPQRPVTAREEVTKPAPR